MWTRKRIVRRIAPIMMLSPYYLSLGPAFAGSGSGLVLVKELPDVKIIAMRGDSKRVLGLVGSKVQSFEVTSQGGKTLELRKRRKLQSIRTSDWSAEWERASDGFHWASYFSAGERTFLSAFSRWRVLDPHGELISSSDEDLTKWFEGPVERYPGFSLFGYRDEVAIVLMFKTNAQPIWAQLDLKTGRRLKRTPVAARDTNTRRIELSASVVFSQDRERFIYAGGGNICVMRSTDLSTISLIPMAKHIRAITLSANGRFVAVAYKNEFTGTQVVPDMPFVEVFCADNGRKLHSLTLDGAESVAISNDGQLLATASKIVSVRDFDLTAFAQNRRRFEIRVTVTELTTGKVVGVGHHVELPDENFVYLSEALDPYAGWGLFFIPNTNLLVSSGGRTKVWEVSRSD